MKTRLYKADDYPELVEWWGGHGWGKIIVPECCVPPTTLIAELDDGSPAAAVVVYPYEGVPMARVGFVVNNPYLPVRVRVAALAACAAATVQFLTERGIVHAQGYFAESAIHRIFCDAGFRETRPAVLEITWSPDIDGALEQLEHLKGGGQ